MATTTTNFGWDIPQSTDLVKDGATAIAALGQDIDTSMVDLKGGTTNQILSKASNTDMDFTWVTPNPGDITGVTAGTGLTGGGTSGSVTLDFDVANYGGGQYAAGKNKIINGDFGIWQRGTSFSNPAAGAYTADRFGQNYDGTGATRTISQQTFTAGTAPVSGYEGTYFYRYALTAAGTGNTYNVITQAIEDVRTFAGQTVTVSLWLKADAARSVQIQIAQKFGSGGSAENRVSLGTASVSTSWQRFSFTTTLASIAGKTIGTNSALWLEIYPPAGSTFTIDIWGVQLEAGSIASPFQTATGTKQGELAACQRYYENSYDTGTAIGSNTQNGQMTFRGLGYAASSSGGSANGAVWNEFVVPFRVKKRGTPSIQLYSSFTGTAARFRNYDAGTDVSGYSLDGIGQMNFSFGGNQFITPNHYCGFHWTADSEL